jgi:outer membrane protein insertion porin family
MSLLSDFLVPRTGKQPFAVSLIVLVFAWSIFLPGTAEACETEKEISRVTFITDISLNHKDLSRGIAAKRGAVCTKEVIEQSIERLRERSVFEIIEFHEIPEGEKVHIQFTLIPYLILSRIRFKGNSAVRSLALRRSVGIRAGEKLEEEQIDQIKQRVLKVYRDQGYYKTEVKVNLLAESTAPLTRVDVRIREGEPRRIEYLDIREGDEERFRKIFDEIRSYAIGKIVTREGIREIRQASLKAFRTQGFYQARISVHPGEVDEDGRQILIVQVNPRNRVRFEVQGSRFFSDDEILAPLRLEQRSVPLGATALSSLCREVEEMYKEAGYIRARITCEKKTEEDKRFGGERDIFSVMIEEGQYYRVRSVAFRGNTALSSSELSKMVNVVPKTFLGVLFGSQRAPTDEIVKSDITRIQDAYLGLGFESVRVRSSIDIDDEARTVRVTYRIRERGTNKLEKVAFVIDYSDQRDEEIVSLLTRWEKDFPLSHFDSARVDTELDTLREEIFALGYPEPRISYQFVKDEAALLISLDLGPKITVGRIILEGNFYTHDRIILREILLNEGDPWNPLKIDESKQALFSLGIFRSVVVKPEGEVFKGPVQNMKVRVLERETGTLQGAVEFSTQDGMRLQMQAGQRNLFGDARALVLALDGYFRGTDSPLEAARTRLAYGSPRFLGTSLDYGLELFYQTTLQQNDSFKLDRVGFSNSVRYPFMQTFRFNLSHTGYSERLFDVAQNNILGSRDTGTTLYSVFRATVELDERDDPFNPAKGYRVELGAGYFPNWAGSEVRMMEFTGQETTYVPVSSSLTYVFNLRGAFRETLDSDEVVPLGSRYFIGGRDTLRGHTRFQVGPRALDDGLVVGGDTFAVFSQELRYLLTDAVVGLLFVDIGQAFLRNEVGENVDRKTQLKDFRISPGFGMQYITPIGPLSAELGFATDREFGERFGRFIVSIGSAF